jgi:arylsulfatase
MGVVYAPTGELTLTYDDDVVGRGDSQLRMPFVMQHGGAHLRLGHDRGFPVCDDYAPPFPWQGVIHRLHVETGASDGPPPADLRRALRAD